MISGYSYFEINVHLNVKLTEGKLSLYDLDLNRDPNMFIGIQIFLRNFKNREREISNVRWIHSK